MIERYSLSSLDQLDTLGVAVATPRYNIAPLQTAPIRTAAGLVQARWGLLPPWRGHGGKRGPHVPHAPLAELDAVPLLRNAFKSGRCLVIADGFFVWRKIAGKKQPIWIHPGRPVALAGVSATHKDDRIASFALVTGATSSVVAAALAPEPSPSLPFVVADLAAWLDGKPDAARAALAAPDAGWRADAVSTWVNSVEHDDPRCVETLRNPAQGTLF